jgi:hypothetical protein
VEFSSSKLITSRRGRELPLRFKTTNTWEIPAINRKENCANIWTYSWRNLGGRGDYGPNESLAKRKHVSELIEPPLPRTATRPVSRGDYLNRRFYHHDSVDEVSQ